jgi:hypothetical protein
VDIIAQLFNTDGRDLFTETPPAEGRATFVGQAQGGAVILRAVCDPGRC